MEFKDKILIVTGGAHDIGLCIADEFRKVGATVYVIDKLPGNHFKVSVNVETIHILKRIFAKLRYLLLAHITNLLRLLPTMPCIDNLRSLHCPDVNIVNIIAVIINTATVKMQVQGS